LVDDSPPHDPNDGDHDDLAALDFSAPDVGSSASVLDAFDHGVGGSDDGDDDILDSLDPMRSDAEADDGDDLPVPLFTVTNPPGTVTVSTFMDGRVNRIDLSAKATTMTESHLADEIVVIARLATQDARSAQYSFMLEGMRQQGHDNVATRDFLTRDLDLPSPEQAEAARAQIFASRYASNHD
jgi:ESX secretion-associated protein EspD/H